MSLKSKIQALITAANTKTGKTDAVKTLVDGYGSGIEITDGIVVKAVDENGWATEIDVYSSDGIPKFYFTTGGTNQFGWWKLEKVNFKPPLTKVKNTSFSYLTNLKEVTGLETVTGSVAGNFDFTQTQIENLSLPNFESATSKWIINYDNTHLKTAYLPKYTSYSYDGTRTEFSSCTALETVQIGSIGYAANPTTATFKGCTQSGLTITAYTRGTNADTVLSNIRNGATNATIIIKASEDTTYGGTSYAAGETMITSEVA